MFHEFQNLKKEFVFLLIKLCQQCPAGPLSALTAFLFIQNGSFTTTTPHAAKPTNHCLPQLTVKPWFPVGPFRTLYMLIRPGFPSVTGCVECWKEY